MEFDCAVSSAISALSTTYFKLFPDTHELDVQVSTNAGSAGFEWEAAEVERHALTSPQSAMKGWHVDLAYRTARLSRRL